MQETITNKVIKQGPSISLSGDSNNCTVLALAATANISYDLAFEIAQVKWKRRFKKGVRTSILSNYFLNLKAKKVVTKKVYHVKRNNRDVTCKMTVGTFAKEYPTGHYYVLVNTHALAINDGKILDHSNLLPKNKRIVQHAWKIK
jgi:hypothetical protein